VADPWPVEGLPLAEALWRIEPDDPRFFLYVFNRQRNEWDRLQGGLDLFGPSVAVPTMRRARVRRLITLLTEGQYIMRGRRGSLVADPQDIPAAVIHHFDFDQAAGRSVLRERVPDGTRWYDVRVALAPPPGAVLATPPSTIEDWPATIAGRTARRLFAAYPAGRPPVPVSNLMEEFSVNRTTMFDALRLLRDRGWN
jgi:hypothetical protein